MRRCFKILILLTISITIIACSNSGARKWRIGISQCSSDDWRTEMNNEIERVMMFHDDVDFEIRSAEDDNERQISDIRYFIDNGFDLIIAAPNEAAPITPIIAEAYDKGIPVITFDREVIGDKYTAHFEVDNYGLGKTAGKYAKSLANSQGDLKIIEIQGVGDMSPTQKRSQGFKDEIKNCPNAKIVASVYGNWNDDIAARLMDSLLGIHPEVNMVYAHNDRMAISASRVARRKGRNDIKYLGIDGSTEIGIKGVADSLIDATFLYPTEGDSLIHLAFDILDGKPYQRNVLIPALSAVDHSNADIILEQRRLKNNEIRKIVALKGEMDDFLSQYSAQTYMLYASIVALVSILLLLFFILRAHWQNKKHKQILMDQNRQLEEQRDIQESLYRQLDDATKSKLTFYTNVSHDLRTPLTLVGEPVDQLIENPDMPKEARLNLLKLARKNIKVLKRLITQILDFRKFESGNMSISLKEANLGILIEEWVESFAAVARRRHIRLTWDIAGEKNLTSAIDVEKMERVFFNLLSNAMKYTPDNGEISVKCFREADSIIISVADSGIGIAEKDLPHIFDNFYRVDSLHPDGSGIGLSLTKAFVELHGGKINVESKYGEGSVFTVSIPVNHVDENLTTDAVYITEQEILSELDKDEIQLERKPLDPEKPTLLVIDDNKDIQKLIEGILSADYNIITADNGKAGLKMATKYVPDIIICDVMMPVLDGLQCCRILKEEVSTSHIPVLMLTACALDEQRVSGYESGADAYLSKPFSGAILRARCANLINNRRRIMDLLQENKTDRQDKPEKTNKKEPTSLPTDIESEFYAEFLAIVNEELSNPNLTIDDLAGRMRLSQSQFTRKIKSLTNYTPVEIIRKLRMARARKLILSTDKTLSEIAYEVGFASPAYFSKCFKDEFGESASELRARLATE